MKKADGSASGLTSVKRLAPLGVQGAKPFATATIFYDGTTVIVLPRSIARSSSSAMPDPRET